MTMQFINSTETISDLPSLFMLPGFYRVHPFLSDLAKMGIYVPYIYIVIATFSCTNGTDVRICLRCVHPLVLLYVGWRC